MVSETKLDNTFPNGQILIDGINEPIRLDRNKTGEVFYYSSEKTFPQKSYLLKLHQLKDFFIEINHYKEKWLLCCSYDPDSNNIKNHLSALSVSLDI